MTRRDLLRTFGLLSGSVLLSGALSGCELLKGLYGGNQNGTGNEPPVETQTVEIINFSFRPASIRVKKGTKVTWVQRDSAPHTVTSTNPAGLFDSGALSQNGRFEFTFNNLGTVEYYCAIHPYMKGKVTVE